MKAWRLRRNGVLLCVAGLIAACGAGVSDTSGSRASADAALEVAISQLVAGSHGPPGVAVVVQRADELRLHTAGEAVLGSGTRPTLDDHMRLASVAKALSGATALALIRRGVLSLDDTIGGRLRGFPAAWAGITLGQLLGHTSGIPDFSRSPQFRSALAASPLAAPNPVTQLSYVFGDALAFPAGSRYGYSNSDNIVVGLMVEAATGSAYEVALRDQVSQPLGLSSTSLPRDAAMPSPYIHGYAIEAGQPPEDVTELFAAGWSGASGGVVSTPGDANRFIRAYAAGATADEATRARQRQFVDGATSEPPGPGANAAGLAIFRYQTSCGTVYGHTGNTPGYTQFIAATQDGSRSATVSVNAQITPSSDAPRFPALLRIFDLAACAALAA